MWATSNTSYISFPFYFYMDFNYQSRGLLIKLAEYWIFKMSSNVFSHGSSWVLIYQSLKVLDFFLFFGFLTVMRNVFQCVPAWRLLCSDLPVPDCCCCYSCVLPPGGRVTSRHGRPSRFNPPFQNFDQTYLFRAFSVAFFSWKASARPKLQSLPKKRRAENVSEGEAVKFNIAFQNLI